MYAVRGIMKALFQHDRGFWKTAPALWLLLLLAIPAASRGESAAALPVTADAVLAPVSAHFAIADFDGDNKPDIATVQDGQASASSKRYWIGLRLSTGPRQFLGITAPVGGLQILLRDINGDNALDLVVTTAWLGRPVAVLVNDGHGNFLVSDPANFLASLGTSEAVWKDLAVDCRDLAAMAATRNFSGHAGPNSRETSLRGTRCRLPRAPLAHATLFSAASVQGRAPPASIL